METSEYRKMVERPVLRQHALFLGPPTGGEGQEVEPTPPRAIGHSGFRQHNPRDHLVHFYNSHTANIVVAAACAATNVALHWVE